MSLAITPTPLNDQQIQMTLDNVVFFIHLAYNSETDSWALGLMDANSQTLIDGISIVPDYPLLSRVRRSTFPAGEILCISPDGRGTVNYDALVDGVCQLIYYTLAEVEAVINGTV